MRPDFPSIFHSVVIISVVFLNTYRFSAFTDFPTSPVTTIFVLSSRFVSFVLIEISINSYGIMASIDDITCWRKERWKTIAAGDKSMVDESKRYNSRLLRVNSTDRLFEEEATDCHNPQLAISISILSIFFYSRIEVKLSWFVRHKPFRTALCFYTFRLYTLYHQIQNEVFYSFENKKKDI